MKLLNKILIALIIQACFFSNNAFAEFVYTSTYHSGSGATCVDAYDYTSDKFYKHSSSYDHGWSDAYAYAAIKLYWKSTNLHYSSFDILCNRVPPCTNGWSTETGECLNIANFLCRQTKHS